MLLFCIFLYVFSNDISVFGGNNHFIKHEDRTINQLINSVNATASAIFNVLDHGAKGDGITNDTGAFKISWDAACKTNGGVILVPSGFTFLIQPVNFSGSNCVSSIVFQLNGAIVAPPNKSDWVTKDYQWILFKDANEGITIQGKGVFDGCGESWWNSSAGGYRPNAVRIWNSKYVVITGITIRNSPRMHIYLDNCKNVYINDFIVFSPKDSPNTDGIHLILSQHVDIFNTTISCGDDCVSIQTGSSDVKIHNVICGPGHGYSIGGLGPKNQEAHVSDIKVYNSIVQNSMTGVRIKTWPGGYGSVGNILFSNIRMSNVGIPMVIDQYYCGGPRICNVTDANVVRISNVTYTNIRGTFTYKSVYFFCSIYGPCRNITVADVEIVPAPGKKGVNQANCSYAYGEALTQTIPSLQNCLLSEGAPNAQRPLAIY